MRSQQGRLRENSCLTASPSEARKILGFARDLGFSRAGFVDPEALAGHAALLPSDDLEWQWAAGPHEWKDRASILVCCLSCHRREPSDLSTPGDPHGLIAPFARRNYYKTAARLMGRLAARMEEELRIPRKDVRIFSNSRLPEKPFCVAAGLAWQGKNGLCIAPGLGSLFVIAGAVIPRALTEAAPIAPRMEDLCGSCRRCLDACPSGALATPGAVDRAKCLQGFAADPVVLGPAVMETWGARLYGCQDCQSACPHNRHLPEEGPSAVGEIGPSVSLRWFLSLDERRVKELFHGTAMGLSWISRDALVRNAIVAAGNSRNPALRGCVTPYLGSATRALDTAARWALERMTGA